MSNFISICKGRKKCIHLYGVFAHVARSHICIMKQLKGGICVIVEFNPQKNISLLKHGCRFLVDSSNMVAMTSCEHTLLHIRTALNPILSSNHCFVLFCFVFLFFFFRSYLTCTFILSAGCCLVHFFHFPAKSVPRFLYLLHPLTVYVLYIFLRYTMRNFVNKYTHKSLKVPDKRLYALW